MKKTSILHINELDFVTGGTWSETINDAKELARRGLWNKKYPAGYTKINVVADKWAPEITQIMASRGYGYVAKSGINGVYSSGNEKNNKYFNREGQQIGREDFWSQFQ